MLNDSKKLFNQVIKAKITPFVISGLLPAILLLFYFIYRQMAPFGNYTILTVDLGQQYIDFFGAFKHALLNDPSSIIYSFSKNIGGSMIGEWSYYLFSPFNLLLLLFPISDFPVAILLITLLKFAASGLSIAYSFYKMQVVKNNWWLPLFAISYAFSGWFIANDVNLMWLDDATLLPLIVWQVDRLIKQKFSLGFILLFALALISNFYIAWMIALFLALYLPWRISSNSFLSFSQLSQLYSRLILHGISSFLLSAFVLLPTLLQLLAGKADSSGQVFDWGFASNIAEIPLKLLPGSFNFSEMKSGQANYFVPIIILFGVIAYLSAKQVSLITKLLSVFVIAILLFSFMYQPLNLLFHGLQFPVWYDYRYSFVLIFFLLLIAANGFKLTFSFSLPVLISSGVLSLLLVVYALLTLGKFEFITVSQIVIFAISAIGFISLLAINTPIKYWLLALSALTTLVAVFHMAGSLSAFSYLTNSEYQTITQSINEDVAATPKDKNQYRIGQTYQRTRGDALLNGFNGSSEFSSMMESKQGDLFKTYGQPEGDYYAAYAYGTRLLDDLFSFKYFFVPNGFNTNPTGQGLPADFANSYRPDYTKLQNGDVSLPTTSNNSQVIVNNDALPVVFGANSQSLTTTNSNSTNSIEAQDKLLQKITGNTNNVYANVTDQLSINLNNLQFAPNTSLQANNGLLTKSRDDFGGVLTVTFTPSTNDSYYLLLNDQFADDQEVSLLTINGQTIPQFPTRRETVALNVASQQMGQPVTIQFTLKENTLSLKDFSLYRLNNSQLSSEIQQLKENSASLSTDLSTTISGEIQLDNNHTVLATSIPYSSGWQVEVDGKKVPTTSIDGQLLAANITPGKHKFTLHYSLPGLRIGMVISLISIIVLIGSRYSITSWIKRNRLFNP